MALRNWPTGGQGSLGQVPALRVTEQ
jgi:hypothetical protein